MSKSLKNVIDPDYLIEKYGADTARMFCLFASPPEKDLEWSDQGVEGSFRFLWRVWRLVMDYGEEVRDVRPFDGKGELEGDLKDLRRKTHQTIKKVTDDLDERFHFNTAISAVMELVNVLYQVKRPQKGDVGALGVVREAVEAVLILLNPIVPHVTEELWEELGHRDQLADIRWPSFDPAVAAAEEMTIVVQVNGKLRGRLVLPVGESDEKIKELALGDEKVVKFLEGKKPLKVVYVPKKLVNIVVKA
jgi:leucyl-tRNA synthetase